jgi:hypothetical protein
MLTELVCFARICDERVSLERYLFGFATGLQVAKILRAQGHAIFRGHAYLLCKRASFPTEAGHDLPHGMTGTVLIALAGEPLTIFELTAR